MSLNNIQLQDFIIGELYKDSLLVSSDRAPAATSPSAPAATPLETTTPYKVLGNHGRKVTILVNAPGSPFLPDNQLNFLTKILEACRLNMEDVAIVNHASASVNITALR